jgi:hypothetical protein
VNRAFSSSFTLTPSTTYQSTNSLCSASNDSTSDFNNNISFVNVEEDDLPKCSICLDVYSDGDELFTLGCSHCFHNDCMSKWFQQVCMDRNTLAASCNCPECRTEHVFSDAQMLKVRNE